MMVLVLILLTLFSIFHLINKKELWDLYSSSSFECGFSSFKFSRFNFSIHYFFVGLLFIFLDLELCIILPFFFLKSLSWKYLNILCFLIFMILLGLILEWMEGTISWKF